MTWKYVHDRRRKHKRAWKKNEAGFMQDPKGSFIGKCPANMTVEVAEALLNSGIEFSSDRWPHDYPERIYNIRDGVVYRATPTVPGESYHGFPEHPDRARKLPRDIKDQLMQLADKLGCHEEVRKWLKA